MITLFENITQQLTKAEREIIVPHIKRLLMLYTGENRRLKNQRIITYLQSVGISNMSEARVRKCIAYIRIMNLLKPYALIGASNGYFITKDIRLVDDQIESLKGRMDAMKNVIESLEAQKQNLKHQS